MVDVHARSMHRLQEPEQEDSDDGDDAARRDDEQQKLNAKEMD